MIWKEFEFEGRNPVTGEVTSAVRRRLEVDFELPMKEKFEAFVAGVMRRE